MMSMIFASFAERLGLSADLARLISDSPTSTEMTLSAMSLKRSSWLIWMRASCAPALAARAASSRPASMIFLKDVVSSFITSSREMNSEPPSAILHRLWFLVRRLVIRDDALHLVERFAGDLQRKQHFLFCGFGLGARHVFSDDRRVMMNRYADTGARRRTRRNH